MAFDFPNSPSAGQQFTPAGGPTYVFNSGVWKIVGSIGAPGNLSLGDTPPPAPVQGQMWLETDTGNLFAWWDDGNSAAWVQINVPNAVNSISNIVQTLITTVGNTTYTKPNGLKFLEVTCYGGGGGGGGAPATAASQSGVGSGGHGGAKAWSLLPASAVGATETMTVGQGGNGVSGGNGTSGLTTSFGALVSAAGGTAGGFGGPSSGNFVQATGSAVLSTAGQVRGWSILAQTGFAAASGTWVMGGAGGSTDLGGAGHNVVVTGTSRSGGIGGQANTGSGGSGGVTAGAAQAATPGGAGGSGVIILKEYF